MTSTLLPDPAAEPVVEAVDPAEPEQKEKAEPRPYVVLRRLAASSPNSPLTLEMVREVTAHSREQAISEVATILFAAGEEPPITLVAVTAKGFKPTTINPKPRPPQLVFS